MLGQMSVQRKFLVMAFLMLATSAAIAFMGFLSNRALTGIMGESALIGNALRNHLEADMMHDALRADVLAALVAAEAADPAAQQAASAALEEHKAWFLQTLSDNEKMDLPAAVKDALAEVKAPLQEYMDSAGEIVALAARDQVAAMRLMPAFSDRFSHLETAMEQVSDRIEAANVETQAAGAWTSRVAAMLAAFCLAVSIAATAGIHRFASRAVVKPLGRITQAMQELAQGSRTIDIPEADRQDEIGAMANALAVFKRNALDVERLADERRTAEARALEERQAAMAALARRFGEGMGTAVETVATAADATAGVSANVQAIATTAEELAASSSEIGQQMTSSVAITRGAVDEASRTIAAATGLVEAAERVGEIVGLISTIAEQTNLLALNATIEAARAGDAGKGFAVVASEVKGLASQTAKATGDIAGQIQAIQSISGEVAQAIRGIGGTISRIDEIAAAIGSAVEEQNAATSDIARNVHEVAKALQKVSKDLTSVHEATSTAGATAAEVLATSVQHAA